ncbi:MAG: hypothetical protein V9G19_09420 [Tetrasphaera sp.]
MTRERLGTVGLGIGGGFTDADAAIIDQATRQVRERLERIHTAVETELSVRDRDRRGMKTTLEVWVPGLPRIVATSAKEDLRDAINEVSARAVSAIDSVTRRRRPVRERVRAFRRHADARHSARM